MAKVTEFVPVVSRAGAKMGGYVQINQLVRFSVIAALSVASGATQAAGFALSEQNASGLGNGYAGQVAAAENASTLFFNPAGMTQLQGRQVSGTVNIIRPTTEFTDNGGSRAPSAALPLGNNGADAGGWNYLPNGFLSWQLSDRLWAGVGVTTPFGLKTTYDPNFIGRFQSQKAQLMTVDVNPGIAFRVNDWLSVGGGVSYQYARLGIDRSFSVVTAARAQTVSLHDGAVGWNIGAMLNAGKDTRIGLHYRSAINYDLTGGVTVVGVGNAGARAALSMPDSASLAVSHQLTEKWQWLGDFTWTHWGRIQNVPLVLTSALGTSAAGTVSDTLDLQFNNSYRVGAGANYHWTDNFMFKLGVAFDKTPVPDAARRSVILPDGDRTWLSFGGKHRLTKSGVLDVGYARLFLKDGDALRSKGVGLTAGLQGTVSGTYKSHVDIASIQYTHSF
jgi:long-chain fatty acid transport protein